MSHTNDGFLQAYLDDELEVDDLRAVESHLGGCRLCRGELRELRAAAEDFSGALLLLDRPAAVAAPRAHPIDVARPSRAWRGGRSVLPRAAALVFLVAGAATAMIPGSPLHDLLRPDPRPAEVAATSEPAAATAPAPEPQVLREAAPEAGVSIDPVDGPLSVVLREVGSGLRIRALLTESRRLGVFASGDAASARFDTSTGRIEVVGLGSGDLRIEIPESAPSATVTIDGREYLVKAGDQLQLTTTAGARTGAEITFRP